MAFDRELDGAPKARHEQVMILKKILNDLKTGIDRLHVFKGKVFIKKTSIVSVVDYTKLEITDANLKIQAIVMKVIDFKLGVFDLF